MKSISTVLHDYRLKKNLSTTQLAEKVGVCRTYISHLENGTRPLSKEMRDKLKKNTTIPNKVLDKIYIARYAD